MDHKSHACTAARGGRSGLAAYDVAFVAQALDLRVEVVHFVAYVVGRISRAREKASDNRGRIIRRDKFYAIAILGEKDNVYLAELIPNRFPLNDLAQALERRAGAF